MVLFKPDRNSYCPAAAPKTIRVDRIITKFALGALDSCAACATTGGVTFGSEYPPACAALATAANVSPKNIFLIVIPINF
jgi:hypothetical protein